MFNRTYAVLLAMAMELVVVEIAMIFLGSELDRRMGWPGYAAVIGVLIGFAFWVIHLIKALKSIQDQQS